MCLENRDTISMSSGSLTKGSQKAGLSYIVGRCLFPYEQVPMEMEHPVLKYIVCKFTVLISHWKENQISMTDKSLKRDSSEEATTRSSS